MTWIPLIFFIAHIILIFMISIFYILQLVAYSKILKKVGQCGWKGLLPIYNYFVLFRVFWKMRYFWIWLGIFSLDVALLILAEDMWESIIVLLARIATQCTTPLFYLSLSANSALSLITVIISSFLSWKIGTYFEKSTGFKIGLVALPFIFYLILGFEKKRIQSDLGQLLQ